MNPTPSQPRDLPTDEAPRPVITLGGLPNGSSSPARAPHAPVDCAVLPERIDALIRVQAAQHTALLSEIGHMRQDIKDLTTSVGRLVEALQPLVLDRADQRAVEKARAEIHQQQMTISKAWADLISSPTTKAVIAAIVAAFGAMGLLRSCGLVEAPQAMPEAQADGAWWRHR